MKIENGREDLNRSTITNPSSIDFGTKHLLTLTQLEIQRKITPFYAKFKPMQFHIQEKRRGRRRRRSKG